MSRSHRRLLVISAPEDAHRGVRDPSPVRERPRHNQPSRVPNAPVTPVLAEVRSGETCNLTDTVDALD